MRMIIEGTITTRSPLHISSPEKNLRYDPKTNRWIWGDKGGFPCTPTRTVSIRSPMATSERDPLGKLRLPEIPPQGIKGRLRRLAAAEIEDALVLEHGQKVPYAVYQAMHSGAVSGNPDGGAPPLDVAKARREHVFAGLFGGGSQMVPGRLKTTGGRVMCSAMFDIGAIPEQFRDEESVIPANSVWQLYQAMPIPRKNDLLQFTDARAEHILENYDEAMLDALDEEAQRRKQDLAEAAGEDVPKEAKKKRPIQALSFAETVIAGIPFYLRIEVNGNEAQAGCLLSAVEQLLLQTDQGIGGKGAIGFGEFGHNLSIQLDDEVIDEAFNAGAVGETALNTQHKRIERVMQAYENALNTITVDELTAMMAQGG